MEELSADIVLQRVIADVKKTTAAPQTSLRRRAGQVEAHVSTLEDSVTASNASSNQQLQRIRALQERVDYQEGRTRYNFGCLSGGL